MRYGSRSVEKSLNMALKNYGMQRFLWKNGKAEEKTIHIYRLTSNSNGLNPMETVVKNLL
jgi:hypothetical protein